MTTKASVNRRTEVRNLDPQDAKMLGHILDTLDSWQTLMERIPRAQASATAFVNIDEPKYSHQDIGKIKEASQESQQNATQILLDEWGTSGRIRPTLEHLLQLLLQLQLYRAADFLALAILKESPPERPATGIAARVDIDLANLLPTAIADASTAEPPAAEAEPVAGLAVAGPGLLELPSGTAAGPNMNRTASKVTPSNMQKVNDHISDFIKFSQSVHRMVDEEQQQEEAVAELPEALSVFRPAFSALQSQSPIDLPQISLLQGTQPVEAVNSEMLQLQSGEVSGHLPAMSILHRQEQTGAEEPHNFPAISMLHANQSMVDGRPQSSAAEGQSMSAAFVPAFSLLQQPEQRQPEAGNQSDSGAFSAAAVPQISMLQQQSELAEATGTSGDFNMPDLSGLAVGSSSSDS